MFVPVKDSLSIIVDFVIFACLNFHEFLILGLVTKFRIREFANIFEFSNLSSSRNSRKLKPREYYQIYSICHLYCMIL